MRDRQALLFALCLALLPAAAAAQGNQPAAPRPDESNPGTAPAPGASSSLSNTLSRSGGVIKPPPTGDANVKTPPPQGNNTPVIPPPGTPGGNPDVQPK